MDERRRRRRRRRTPREEVGLWLSDRVLVIGVVFMTLASMLLVGAVHVPVILTLALVALPLGAAAVYRLRGEHSFPRGNPVWALGGLAAFCVVQALPLPDALTKALAPQARAVWEDCLRPFGEQVPAWHSLSVDTGATWIEATKWFAYAAVFAASTLLALRGRSMLLWLTLFGSALLAAGVSAAHLAVGATRLYGIYQPQFAVTPWHVAPLLNPNNLSGYLLLGVFAGFAVLLARRPVLPPAVVLVALAGLLAVLILTGSRGGVAALIVGLLSFFVFLLLGRRSPSGLLSPAARRMALLGVAAVALAGIGFAALAAGDSTRIALQDESFSKLSVATWTLGLVRDNWLFGVGRGAFETAFPPYRAGLGRLMFQYPENFVVQWFSEWGVVVSLAAFAWLVRAMRPWRFFASQTSNAALAIGVGALLLQNLVDLGLEVMSVGIATSVALGALTGALGRREVGGKPDDGGLDDAGPELRTPLWRSAWVMAPLALALLSNAAGWATGLHTAIVDRTSLRAAYDELTHDKSKAPAFRSELHAAIVRHPGDAYLPLLGALAAFREHQDAMVWLNRALERDPERGATHFVLARVLLARGSIGQGMLALRFAVQRQPEFLHRAAVLVGQRARRPEEVWAAVPEGTSGVPMLLALALAAERGKSSVVPRDQLVDEAVRRDPHSQPARLAELRGLLANLKAARDPCLAEARAACLQRVDRALQELERSAKEPVAEVVLAEAQRRALDGKLAEADAYLADHCPALAGPTSCLRERVLYALDARNVKASTDAATAYLASACDTAASCAKASIWVGDRMQEHGDSLGAVEYYARAAKDRPDPAVWKKLASATRATGQLRRFEEANQRAQQAEGTQKHE
jgi:tetratricopeptide (TPR) repeat protein